MIKNMSTEEIREELRSYNAVNIDQALRKELHVRSKDYRQLHTDAEYLAYLEKNECSFEQNGECQTNFPYVWTMFSEESQHVMGDSVKELLDRAINGDRPRY